MGRERMTGERKKLKHNWGLKEEDHVLYNGHTYWVVGFHYPNVVIRQGQRGRVFNVHGSDLKKVSDES